MEFQCRLGSAGGEVLEGLYVAEDEATLRREFKERGLCVLSLKQSRGLSLATFSLRRIKPHEFIIFNQELAALLKAGMPLTQSLEILRQRVENPLLKSVLNDVYERVRSGSALSESFEAQENLFPGVYTASLMAGEKSGSLEEVLRRYVAHARSLSAIRRKTISAMIYPAVLLALSFLVVGIIVLRVVPEFADFYQGLEAELPLGTRAIMEVSEFLQQNLVLIVGGGVGTAVFLWVWLRQHSRQISVDRFMLRVPGVGNIARKFAMSQLSHTLATLLRGGIPLVSALEVAARSIGNRYFAVQLESVRQEVREGEAFSMCLSKRSIFPGVAIKMVEVGESTGDLQEMLSSVGDFFDEEIETSLSRFVTLIEPLLLVIMGIVIACLLLALYLPLLQLGSILS